MSAKRNYLRFSLKTLMLATLLASAFLAGWSWNRQELLRHRAEAARARAALEAGTPRAVFDYIIDLEKRHVHQP